MEQGTGGRILLSAAEAAELCGYSERAFRGHVAKGNLPGPVIDHKGRGRRWSKRELEELMSQAGTAIRLGFKAGWFPALREDFRDRVRADMGLPTKCDLGRVDETLARLRELPGHQAAFGGLYEDAVSEVESEVAEALGKLQGLAALRVLAKGGEIDVDVRRVDAAIQLLRDTLGNEAVDRELMHQDAQAAAEGFGDA